MQQNTVRDGGCRRHSEELAGKPAFSEKISFAQNAESCFFPSFRYNAQLHLSALDKKKSVRRIALCEYRVPLFERHHIPALPDGREKSTRIENERLSYGISLAAQSAVLTGFSLLPIMKDTCGPRLVCCAHNRKQKANPLTRTYRAGENGLREEASCCPYAPPLSS